jgi:hypothetical protein
MSFFNTTVYFEDNDTEIEVTVWYDAYAAVKATETSPPEDAWIDVYAVKTVKGQDILEILTQKQIATIMWEAEEEASWEDNYRG